MNPRTTQHTLPTHHPSSTLEGPATAAQPARPLPPRGGRRLLLIGGAAAAAWAVWWVAGPVLGTDLAAAPSPGAAPISVTAGSVLVSSIVAGLLGWALLAALEHLVGRGTTIWRWVAGTVAVLSLAGPLTLAETTSAAAVLVLLHVVVAGVLIPALPGAAGGRVDQ